MNHKLTRTILIALTAFVVAVIVLFSVPSSNKMLRAATGDRDGDGIADNIDNCPYDSNITQTDTDHDGMGDFCDMNPFTPDTGDSDLDTIPDYRDNCPTIPNSNQADDDHNNLGNACDSSPGELDTDRDGVPNSRDNCSNISNANQADIDGDAYGDACDSCPNDPNQHAQGATCTNSPPAGDGDPAPAGDGDPAPAGDGDPAPDGSGDPAPDGGALGVQDIGIYNPLNATDFPTLLQDIIQVLIRLGIPVIVFMIIYAGFLYVTARGNPEQISKAHTTLLWTLVGAAVLLGSMVIAKVVQTTIDSISI